jgi:hypothetical protein
MLSRLFRQVLAAAEADLQPDVARRRPEKGARIDPIAVLIYGQAGKKFIDQPLTAGPQRPAFAPAVKNMFAGFTHRR